jgi:hypothetical protein
VIPEAAAPLDLPPPETPAAPPPRWGPAASLGLTVAVIAAWGLAQAVVIAAFLAAKLPLGPSHLGLAVSLTTLAGAPVGIALTLLFSRLRRGATPRDYLGLHRPGLRHALLWSLALALLLAGYDLLARALDRPVSPPVMIEAYRTSVVPALFWLAVVVAAPAFEEVLFRGFLLPGLAPSRLGLPGAVAVSALLFAVLHFQYDLFDMASVLALGILFGAARLASGSLPLTFGLHAVTNLLAMVQIATMVDPV